MKIWNSGLRLASLAILLVACLASSAMADVVSNVTASEGPDWVKVNIHGGHNYTVKHLPPGSSDYRTIAIDVHGASIAGGLEPKAVLPVNFGLIGNVKVRQMGSSVRILIEVINWPEYEVMETGNGVQVALKAYIQRANEPDGMY